MDIAGMTERIVQAAVAQWAKEIPYAVAVAMGEIPAYQNAVAVSFWIGRGRALMKNRKREVIEKHGQAEYDAILKAFDELEKAWEQQEVAQDNLKAMKDKHGAMSKMVLDWD